MLIFSLAIGGISVDTFPLFVQLAADTPVLYPEIDRLYEGDEIRYQKIAAASSYFDHPIFTIGSIDRQIYARKYLGLLLAGLADRASSPLFDQTFALVSKRWPDLYDYIKDNREVDLSILTQAKYQCDATKDYRYNNLLSGAMTHFRQHFLTLYPVIDPAPQAALKFALFTACLLGRNVVVNDPALLIACQMLGSNITKTNELDDLKQKFNQPKLKKMAKRLKNEIYQRVCNDPHQLWTNDRFLEGLAHCSAYLSSEEGISLLHHNLLTPPKDRDVELLCRLYIIKLTADCFRQGEFSKTQADIELECTEFVMLGLNLLEFIREYKKAKKYYFAHNATHLKAELNSLQEKITVSEAELRSSKSALSAKSVLLSEKEKAYEQSERKQQLIIDALTRENNQLRAQISQLNTSSDPELSAHKPSLALRKMATLSLHDTLLDTNNDLEKLSKLKGLVIGGAEGWQNKLKSQVPHFIYLHADANSFDESLVMNADIIFANIRCKFSHTYYYKLMRIVRHHQKQIVFLSKTNITLTIHQMANAMNLPAVSPTSCSNAQ